MGHKQEYFFCYTKSLSDHLVAKGFRYITVAQNPKSQKLFSLFPITTGLDKTIQEFKNK